MKRSSYTVAALMALACSAARADNVAVRSQLDKLNAELQRLTGKKDVKGVMSLMTPDFMMKQSGSKWISRSQAETQMRQTWPHIVRIKDWELRIRDLTLKGDAAVGLVDEKMMILVKDGKGIIHQVAIRTISRNTWQRTPKGWRFRRIEDLVSKTAQSSMTYVVGVAGRQRPNPTSVAKSMPTEKVTTVAEAKKTLERAYAVYHRAFRAKDGAGVMSIATPNYTVEYPTRILLRWQVEEALKRELKMTRSVGQWTVDVSDVSVSGDTITAVVKEHKVSSIVDEAGKAHTQIVDDKLRDTWIRTSAGWRNRSSVVLGAKVAVDGQVRVQ